MPDNSGLAGNLGIGLKVDDKITVFWVFLCVGGFIKIVQSKNKGGWTVSGY